MRCLILFCCFLLFTAIISCDSDDNADDVRPAVTSFSGTMVYENMSPVTNGELSIAGIDSGGITGPTFPVDTILKIEDGTFEVVFETLEEIDRFDMVVRILEGTFTVNTFVGGGADGLQCLPGNCNNFPPGQDYELTILVPCNPGDCVQFPPP